MLCIHCKKEMNSPLVLFNGEITCPKCKKSLTKATKFNITKENQELYKLSETIFFKALTYKNFAQSDKDYNAQERIQTAIKYCTTAAMQSNPFAMVRLGYYFEKGFVKSAKTLHDCWTIAYGFYASVCFSNQNTTDVHIEKGLFDQTDDEVMVDAKRSAARYMLDMLLTSDEEFNKIDRFNFDTNRKKIEQTLNISESRRRSPKATNVVSQIVENVESCLNPKHAPLFGYFKIDRNQLVDLVNYKVNNKEFLDCFAKKIALFYVECYDNGKVDPSFDANVHIALDLRRRFDENLENDRFSKTGYLFFCNRTTKNWKKIYKALTDKSAYTMRALINAGAYSQIFTEDDIAQFVTIENIIKDME